MSLYRASLASSRAAVSRGAASACKGSSMGDFRGADTAAHPWPGVHHCPAVLRSCRGKQAASMSPLPVNSLKQLFRLS